MRPVSIMRIEEVEDHGKSSGQSSISKVALICGYRAESGRGALRSVTVCSIKVFTVRWYSASM